MKKIFLLLLSIATLPIYCMQKERPVIYPCINIGTTIPVYISTKQLSGNNMPVCETVQSGWQQLEEIANIAKEETNPTELRPIYRPIQKEKDKVLLETDLSEKLYNDSLNLMQTYNSKKLIALIADFNNAKNSDISEDAMSKLAFDKKIDENNIKIMTFFGYLKYYNTQIESNNEPIPSYGEICLTATKKQINNHLADILNLYSSKNSNSTEKVYNAQLMKEKYPTFHQLRHNLQRTDYYKRSEFFSYIYQNKENQQPLYADLSYNQLKKLFYEDAVKMVKQEPYNLHMLLEIIEAGKKLTPTKDEDSFGNDIITTELPIEKKIALFLSCPIKLAIIQKRITVICQLIKKYNDQRNNKITPTEKQVLAYQNRLLDFAFPDSFDQTVFDDKIYAFNELNTLSSNIHVLQYSKHDEVEECFNQLYPHLIKTT